MSISARELRAKFGPRHSTIARPVASRATLTAQRMLVLSRDWGMTAIAHIREAHTRGTDPAYHTFAAAVCARLAVHAAGQYLAAREAVS